MLPLSQLKRDEARALSGLFFDLDDTLLSDGRLTESAYSSLFRLQESGLALIALTGRPASWAELICGMWPVDAAIAENGPLAFTRVDGAVSCSDTVPSETRALRRIALSELVAEARAQIPALVPARDVGGRVTDYTFDIGEYERATEETISAAMALARRRGARTTRSSVHLHFTFDRADKATGALSYLSHKGVDPTLALSKFAFIGDSENDAPMFSAFRTTVGVKNLRGRFSIPPRYQTKECQSGGFSEFAAHLIELRQS